MGNKNNKKNEKIKKDPSFDNDQLGENAHEMHAQDYAQKGRTDNKKIK